MKESEIRKKAIKILEQEGYAYWWPKKVKYHETDIFGVFDIIAVKKGKDFFCDLIQITTLSNISARVKKVKAWVKKNRVNTSNSAVFFQVWGYDKKKREFKSVLL